MGEARQRRLASLAPRQREETPEELARPVLGDLRTAHLPTAMAYIQQKVKAQILELYGDKPRLVANREACEPARHELTPNLVWGLVLDAIDYGDWNDASKRALRKLAPKQFTMNKLTLERLNVACGGRERSMARSYYGED
jgi:hypothetical protein